VRRLHLDQYEFDSPDAEEELDLTIGTTDQFRDLAAFAHWAGINTRDRRPVAEMSACPLSDLARCRWVLDSIRRFAGLELPDSVQTIVLNDEWDDLELVLVVGRYFVWYHWGTTA
jgi:hypothetical protein